MWTKIKKWRKKDTDNLYWLWFFVLLLVPQRGVRCYIAYLSLRFVSFGFEFEFNMRWYSTKPSKRNENSECRMGKRETNRAILSNKMKEKQFYIGICFLLFVNNRVQLDFDEMARIQYIYLFTYTKKNRAVIKTHILY